jgi:hypothetical protein
MAVAFRKAEIIVNSGADNLSKISFTQLYRCQMVWERMNNLYSISIIESAVDCFGYFIKRVIGEIKNLRDGEY